MQNKTKRLHILSPQEIKACYSIPLFNAYERKLYFNLNAAELAIAHNYQETTDSVHFIILLGYCKAKNNLFVLHRQVPKKDIDFIYKTYFPLNSCCYTVNPSSDSPWRCSPAGPQATLKQSTT